MLVVLPEQTVGRAGEFETVGNAETVILNVVEVPVQPLACGVRVRIAVPVVAVKTGI